MGRRSWTGIGGCVPPADLALRRVAVAEPSRDFTEDFIRVEGLPQEGDVLSPVRVELFVYVQVGGHQDRGDQVVGLRSEEHTSELQSRRDLVCRLLLEKKKNKK